MQQFEKFGKFLTPEMIERNQLPRKSTSVMIGDREYTNAIPVNDLNEHLALGAVMNAYIYNEERKDEFLLLHDCVNEALAEYCERGPFTDDNSWPVVRGGNQVTREPIGLYSRAAELFIEKLYIKSADACNWFDYGNLDKFPQIIQFMYISEAIGNSIVTLDETLAGYKWSATVECKDGEVTITPDPKPSAAVLREALAQYISKDILPEEFSEADIEAVKTAVFEYFIKK